MPMPLRVSTQSCIWRGRTSPSAGQPTKKAKIRDSRVKGTQLLCETLTRLSSPPKVLVSASAIGYYGDRGEETLTDESAPGRGFLAEVCRAWEAATEPARQQGIRVVQLRLGVVLSAAGGALAKMLPPFRLGLGGVLGSGQQYMSWIALDDVVGRHSACARHRGTARPDERGGPASRHQSGVHQDTGKSSRAADGHSAASVCGASHVWGDGRRAVTGKCPYTADQTSGLGIPVPLS